MRIFRVILVIVGCLHLCGGHYGVLQVLAWGNMLVDYSEKNGWAVGVKQTFDGDHPCALCQSIAAEKKEQQREPTAPGQRGSTGLELKNLLAPTAVALKKPRFTLLSCARFIPPLVSRSATHPEPEMPPPRFV